MSLATHYDAMRATAFAKLAQGAAELDPLLDAPHDTRRGLTLLIRPPAPIRAAIQAVLADFQALEPSQYYQPAADLHCTILSIISCYEGFTLADINPAAYQAIVGPILARTAPFTITLTGLTASAGGVLVQGFPQGAGLEQLRAELRAAFRASGLPQSIDQRYSIQTAHITVVRFRAAIRQPERLIQAISRYRHHPFGSFEANRIELVFNDWYQRAATTRLLATYALPPARSAPEAAHGQLPEL